MRLTLKVGPRGFNILAGKSEDRLVLLSGCTIMVWRVVRFEDIL